jgi:nitrogen fixation NifU-like protein
MRKPTSYSKKVIDYFSNPHNYGKIKNPSGIGKVGNIVCGDVLWLYIKVEKDRIKDIKYETFGCVAAISTSGVVTDLAKGKTIKEALKIDSKKVVKLLGGLPPIKIHCSLLGVDALSEAIYDYLSKNKKEIPKELEKRHQKIEKEKKEIEKRYKKWTK